MVRVAKIMVVLGLLVLSVPAWAVEVNEPVSHWKFDEGSGTTAYDSAGDNDGTVYGALWTTGQIDGALSFDGVNDYVDCGSSFASVTGSTTKTIMAWAKSDVSDRSGRIITLYRRSDSYSAFVIYPRENPEGNPATWKGLYAIAGNGRKLIDSGVPVTADEWTHIALVQGGAAVHIYVDGVLENSAFDAAAPYLSNPPHAVIGTYMWYGHGPSPSFLGSIDDVRIYDRALSAEEIQQLYWAGFSSSERAVMAIAGAIDEKLQALEKIDAALEKEWLAYDALDELLASGDYEGLSKRDIVKAKQGIHSAIQRQEQAADALERSIEKLEDSLSVLGYEVEPNGSNN